MDSVVVGLHSVVLRTRRWRSRVVSAVVMDDTIYIVLKMHHISLPQKKKQQQRELQLESSSKVTPPGQQLTRLLYGIHPLQYQAVSQRAAARRPSDKSREFVLSSGKSTLTLCPMHAVMIL